MKQDDTRVSNDELLFRLVPPAFARRHPNNPGIVEMTSGVFHANSLSALRLAKIDFVSARKDEPQRGRAAKLNYGVAIISAGFIRSLGCVICFEDEREFPPDSHVVIYRDQTGAPVSKSQYKNMTFAANLAVPPSGIWKDPAASLSLYIFSAPPPSDAYFKIARAAHCKSGVPGS